MQSTQPVTPPPGVRNDFLDRLHEVVPPEPVLWTPQTVGWYVLAGLVLLGLAWLAWRFWQHWSANRFRRQALAELAVIEQQLASPEGRVAALRTLPGLLKRTALAVYPRAEVAGLHGTDWLRFLDAGLGSNEFSAGAGKYLTELPYLPVRDVQALDDRAARSLFEVARRWMKKGAAPR